jgi:hypothetical protein
MNFQNSQLNASVVSYAWSSAIAVHNRNQYPRRAHGRQVIHDACHPKSNAIQLLGSLPSWWKEASIPLRLSFTAEI